MRTRLHQAWQRRPPRQRMAIAILAALLGVVLYLWLVQSASRARSQLQGSVATLRSSAAALDQQALELERLRAGPGMSVSRGDLAAQVQVQVDARGLGAALLKIDPQDANQVAVAFGAVSFADWLGWVASLDAQQVRVSACRIEALPEPGMVGVTATLQRAQ